MLCPKSHTLVGTLHCSTLFVWYTDLDRVVLFKILCCCFALTESDTSFLTALSCSPVYFLLLFLNSELKTDIKGSKEDILLHENQMHTTVLMPDKKVSP